MPAIFLVITLISGLICGQNMILFFLDRAKIGLNKIKIDHRHLADEQDQPNSWKYWGKKR